MQKLTATVDTVTYYEPDRQWAVVRVTTEQGEEATIVGKMAAPQPGLVISADGTWVTDPKFGKQFRADTAELSHPKRPEGVILYLGSGAIAGIGPQLAERIVAMFGKNTLEVLDKEPKKLLQIPGIGNRKLAAIEKAWREHRDSHRLLASLQEMGLTTSQASRVLKAWGPDALVRLRINPYRLAMDVHGIGFRTADQIAQKLGFETTMPARLEAGLLHVMGEYAEKGHTRAKVPEVLSAAQDLLSSPISALDQTLERLAKSDLVRVWDGWVALTWLFHHEEVTARALLKLARQGEGNRNQPTTAQEQALVQTVQSTFSLELAEKQLSALYATLREKLLVITGGPGVGKTTVLRTVVELLLRQKRNVLLAAPTGKAARRLSEAAGKPSTTIHRLLEYQVQNRGFARNRDRPLECHTLILDEASMIDIVLFRSVMDALPESAQLILVGDVDQLPSVGPGAVLADIIAAKTGNVITLDEVFRQSAQSQIVVQSHNVRAGHLPQIPAASEKEELSDFYLIERDSERVVETVLELVTKRIPERFGFDPMRDVQVLVPMHRGSVGTEVLNNELQAGLNPPALGHEFRRGKQVFRQNDKVLQLKNNYDIEVSNGETGIISGITDSAVLVELADSRVVAYSKDDLDELALGYAMSVHKSQGGEFPCVVLVLTTQHFPLLGRNLLYTAMTRAKKLLVIVGQKRALQLAISKTDRELRSTSMGELLISLPKRPADEFARP